MNQDKINKIFDNVQSIGHLIINFVFTLFLIVVIILSKNILFFILLFPLVLVIVFNVVKFFIRDNKIIDILYDILLFIIFLEILLYIIK